MPAPKPKPTYREDGRKRDAGKPPMSLLDRDALVEIAHAMAYGAEKYAPHDWRGGIRYSRLLDSALRHVFAVAAGEDVDEESGCDHAALACCQLMFLIWMMRHRRDLDDRPSAPGVVPVGRDPILVARDGEAADV